MLTKKQIEEIREHLERAQNPIFYFDNDCDGLCSYVLLRKFIGRGYGVAIKSYPALDASYARKAQELKADYVFVLDKPVISEGFGEEIAGMGLPFIWIDHHDEKDNLSAKFDNVHAYNPARNNGKDKSTEPVAYLSYQIAGRKEDMWVSMIGCIADCFMPDFADEFAKRYPEYWGKKVEKPFDVLYTTEIGNIALGLNFGLKDSPSNIVYLQNFLIECKNPSDVFSEVVGNKNFRKKHSEIKKRYDSLMEKAQKNTSGKLIFFEYGGETSMSSDLSNALSYFYSGKYIAVAYRKAGVYNVSMRGKGIKKILLDVLKEFKDATGGGHEDAVGAVVKKDDLDKFKELLEKEIRK